MKKSVRFALLSLLACCSAFAAEPWEGPPFSADPKAMLAAAEAIRPTNPDDGVLVLLDEETVTFDAAGRSTRVERLLYRVIGESSVDGWSTIETTWQPWYHEQPVVDARVVAKDGSVHRLDPKSFGIGDAEDAPDMFSDTRILSGPLPAVAPGSIVEQTITWREKNPLYTAGTTERHQFGRWVESRQSRLTIEWPAGVEIHTVNRTRPVIEPRATESNGITRLVFETGPIPGFDFTEWNVPADANLYPYVAWSTGKSWQEVAKRYSEIVDEKIGDLAVVDRITRAALGDAKTPRDIAVRLLAAVQRDIRYAGVEFGEGSIVPRAPAETLKNKYGDCKDKATLLVAMLRRAGVPAHVALLRSGSGYDVEPGLPGLGYFDHVIVVTEGADPIWIDPTDEFARVNELPESDQGRLVLVANPATTALLKSPQDDSRANRSVERREFKLPEDGKATIVETTDYFGSDERSSRRYYNGSDQKNLREGFESYAKNAYLGKMTKWETSEPRDLTKPFRIRVEMNEATRGLTGGGEAAVGVFLSRLVSGLPDGLTTEIDEKDPEYKPRKYDFEFPRPYVLELHYVIEPPPGYVVRSVPENETLKLGTTTLSKTYQLREDGVLLADYAFDSGPRRISAAKYEEVRRAIAPIANAPAFLLYFDQVGRKYLDAGDVGKAVAEFRRLATLHPKEALHQADIARALLAGGMGAAARREAQRAIDIDPKSPRGHAALGFVLTHDLIGREMRKGFDLEGSIAAYRKAKQLEPDDINIRAELAVVLQHDADGTRYGKGARLDEAIAEYLAMKKEIENPNLEAIDRELMTLYARTGKWDELSKLTVETKDTEQKQAFVIVAAGASKGADAAVKAARATEMAKRRDATVAAAGFLALLRNYPVATALFAEAAQGAPNATQLAGQAEIFRKTVRFEDRQIDPSDPKSVWYQAMREFALHGSLESIEKLATAEAREVFKEDGLRAKAANAAGARERTMREMREKGEVIMDVALSNIEIVQDGSDAIGHRLRARALPGAPEGLSIYVAKENGQYRIAGANSTPPELALHALRLAERNEAAAAKQWLDWAREHVKSGFDEDPLQSEPFAAVWTRGKEASIDEMRLAAAVLLPDTVRSAEIAIPILTSQRPTAPPDVQMRVDQALLTAYNLTKNWKELLTVADRLAEKQPESERAFAEGAFALLELGRGDEARTRAMERLQRLPDDSAALHVLGEHAVRRSEYDEAITYYARLLDRTKPSARDYNQYAWTALFAKADLNKALEFARQATSIRPEHYGMLNTLAAVYAEMGKTSEARDALLKSLETRETKLNSADWYVVGRIAESYGIRDVAVDAYQRVEKDDHRSSSWELAQNRLARLK